MCHRLTDRPKILCTRAVFYIYIILVALMCLLIGGVIVCGALFPVYSLYLAPYLPTQKNLHTVTNTLSRTSFEQLQDIFVNKNFSTNSLALPDNYRMLLNVTIEHGESMYKNCNSYLEDGKDVLLLIQDVKNLTQNKDTLLASLPPVDTVLSGLNATFYPYVDYLPLQIPLVSDVVAFFKEGNYTYASLRQFVVSHHILTRDVMDLKVNEVIDIALDPLSILDPAFVDTVKTIAIEAKRNATEVGTDLQAKGSEAYTRGTAIVSGFLNNEDLGQFAEIPSEFVPSFSFIQKKYVMYKSILAKAVATLPSFVSCIQQEGEKQVGVLKRFVVSEYLAYFKVHFLYTLMVVLVVVALVVLLVLLCMQGWKLAQETLAYAKSLLKETSLETVNAINEFGHAVQQCCVCCERVVRIQSRAVQSESRINHIETRITSKQERLNTHASSNKESYFESLLMCMPVVIHPQLIKKSKIFSFRSTSIVIFFATSSRDANPFLHSTPLHTPHLQHS